MGTYYGHKMGKTRDNDRADNSNKKQVFAVQGLGRPLPAYPEDKREEKYKVKGCQSQVWLCPEFKDGRVYFHADSDALLVKGIVGILTSVYSDATPDEILSTKPEFLSEVGITEHLSMNRSNGLAAMMKQIQMYAVVYKSMAMTKV